jgi:uncharacterized protein
METDRLHALSHWATTLTLGITYGVGLELFDLFGKQPLLTRLLGKPPDLSRFPAVRGNLQYALLIVVVMWVPAAFGEELVYRGYLMNRVADLGGGTRTVWIASLLLISALFGFSHYHQGLTGILEEGSDGLILGLVYLLYRRNLAIPIVAHGVCDTIDIALLFLGKYPGRILVLAGWRSVKFLKNLVPLDKSECVVRHNLLVSTCQ